MVVVEPKSKKHKSTLIFLHGLGDNGNSWSSILSGIRPNTMKLICPTAECIPVAYLDSSCVPAWFDIDLKSTIIENEDDLKKSCVRVHRMIEKEIGLGISPSNIIVGGFSQGGALAIYAALKYHKKIGGIIVLSGWLPMFPKFPQYVIDGHNIPIFQAHGTEDTIIPITFANISYKMLQSISTRAALHIYTGLKHSICNEELNDVKIFIKQITRDKNKMFCFCIKRKNN